MIQVHNNRAKMGVSSRLISRKLTIDVGPEEPPPRHHSADQNPPVSPANFSDTYSIPSAEPLPTLPLGRNVVPTRECPLTLQGWPCPFSFESSRRSLREQECAMDAVYRATPACAEGCTPCEVMCAVMTAVQEQEWQALRLLSGRSGPQAEGDHVAATARWAIGARAAERARSEWRRPASSEASPRTFAPVRARAAKPPAS